MVITDFNNELTLSFNRICFSSDFRIYFSSRHTRTPNGFTIGVSGETKNDYCLDAYDFYTDHFDFTDEHLNTVIEYFKNRKPEFYAEYMADVPIYKSEMEMERSMLSKGK